MMYVIKKDGTLDPFNSEKIKRAITQSASRAMVVLSDTDKANIVCFVKSRLEEMNIEKIPIQTMHNLVEKALEEYNPNVAKSYRDYRNYKQDFIHILDEVYKASQNIRFIGDKENANTDSTLVATKRCLIFNELNKRLYRKFFMTKDELQACKEGYIYVHDQSARLDTMNCFDRSTRFITDKGVKSFYDFTDGDEVKVLSHKGVWRKATVHSYGWQPIQKVTLKRGSGKEKQVLVTKDHRWILKDGTETTCLKVGDKLVSTPDITQFNWEDLTREEKKLWCLGFSFADGSVVKDNKIPTMHLRLFGSKKIYASRFIDVGYSVTTPKSLDGDLEVRMTDVHSKELPYLQLNHSNILYFVNGYLCADGNRNLSFNSASEFRGVQVSGELNNHIYDLLNIAGYYVTNTTDLTGQTTNYGVRTKETKSYQLYSNCGDKTWVVKNIEPIKLNPKAQVWCLEVEVDHSFLLENGIPTGNCCLCDAGNLMRGGFEMANQWYNEPKTVRTAFSVLGDIILSTASQQYGGFTIPEIDKIMGYYARKSYDIYVKEWLDVRGQQTLTLEGHEWALKKVKKEIEQGYQGIEMKLNTVGSSRGDYPFITFSFGLGTDRFEKMTSKVILSVHKKGQGKKGFERPVLFPKLVFLYDEDLHEQGCINEDLFNDGIDCSCETMYPDWLSLTGDGYVASMYKKYKRVVSPMGCVDGQEVITYKFHDKLFVESFERMWGRITSEINDIGQSRPSDTNRVVDLRDYDVLIYDTLKGFVKVKYLIRNLQDNWCDVTMSNGRKLRTTTDHPFETDRGVVLAKDLDVEDVVRINTSQYAENVKSVPVEEAWLYGFMLCDGCYQNYSVVASIASCGEDDIEEHFKKCFSKVFNLVPQTVLQERGNKGTYKDLRVYSDGITNLKDIISYFTTLFGGIQKKYRHIPNEVFSYSEKARYAFLAGMIDADGYINDNTKKHKYPTVQLGSTNKELALQQMALAQSLGMKARMYTNHYCASDKNKIRYRVEFFPNRNLIEQMVCNKKKCKWTYFRDDNEVLYSHIIDVEPLELEQYSYDVTTESEHFEVSGVYSHNCRAFLSPYYERGGFEPADEDDKPVFVGRFNIGAVSLNLPMILAKSRRENRDFYEVLDYYLEMIRQIHCRTYEYLGEMRASINPVMFCEGGFYEGNLKPNQKIKENYKILESATASFGFTALNELQRLYNGKSIREDGQFALDVLQYINKKAVEFKEIDHHLYALYGTPAENLCGLQIKQFREEFGIIENVSDRPYVSNSFHCHVTEDMSPIEKQDKEKRFWDLSNGGKIQYVRYPLGYNRESVVTLVRRAMKMGFYEGVNLALCYCKDCGYSQVDMGDECPKCHSHNIFGIDRMNGYLAISRNGSDSSSTRLNDAVMANIKDRRSM